MLCEDPGVDENRMTADQPLSSERFRALLARALAVVAAFAVGWVVYMVGMVLTVYDGLLSLIFQPIMAGLWSGFVVVLSLLVGLVLRVRPVSRVWNGSRGWAVLIISVSLFVLIFGYFLGLTYVGINPETEAEVEMLHPAAAMACYFSLLFAIANWPVRRASRTRG
jgi:hypothetical protein